MNSTHHEPLHECTLSDLDLFTPPYVQSDVKNGFYEEINPISKLSDGGSIDFFDSNLTEYFIDLANSYLTLKIQILKGNGDNIVEKDTVATTNYPLASIFEQVDVSLNGTLITSSNNNYAYRSYMDVLLNYGRDAKKSQLQMGLYDKDQVGAVSESNYKKNSSLRERVELFKNSNIIELCGRIHSDIFNQDRLLLNGVSIKISFHRNRPEFSLITEVENADYKIAVLEATLNLRKVQLTSHKFEAIQKGLEKSPCLYPFNRVDVKTHSVAAGLSSLTWHSAIQGILPNRVVIGIVKNQNFVGDYKSNPFDFAHHFVRSVCVSHEGEYTSAKKLKVNFEKRQYIEGYQSLFQVSGKHLVDAGFDFTRNDYRLGYALFGFDQTATLGNLDHFEPTKRGSLKIEIEFQKPLETTVTVIVFADFENVLSIDKFRNVLKQY